MNNQRINIGEIFLGEVDGESEAKRDDFNELFYGDKEIYKQLTDEDKFLVIGRKGTGKSFLGNYLNKRIQNKGEKYKSRIYTGKDLNLHRMIGLGQFEIDAKQGENIWEYVLLNIFAEMIIEEKSLTKYIPFTGKNKLRRFLNDPEKNFKATKFTQSTTSKFTASIKNKATEVGADAQDGVNINFELKKYYENLPKLKQLTISALSKSNITLIIDDLDELRICSKMDEYYSQCIANLINVSKHMNIELSCKTRGKNKIIILLRDDIVEYLNENDSNINKAISNKFIKLDWWEKDKDKKPYEYRLMQMILLKVRKSTPEYKDMADGELYKLLFPKKVEGKEVINYLLDYSFGRPRDIIQYLNIVRDKERIKKTFDAASFKKYKKEYSEAFYRELKNEISIHERSELLKETIKLIQDFKHITFAYEDIEKYYTDRKENYTEIKDLKEALKEMYKLGVIGNTWNIPSKTQGAKPQHRVAWAYRDDNGSDLNLSKRMKVHNGLSKAFKLN